MSHAKGVRVLNDEKEISHCTGDCMIFLFRDLIYKLVGINKRQPTKIRCCLDSRAVPSLYNQRLRWVEGDGQQPPVV